MTFTTLALLAVVKEKKTALKFLVTSRPSPKIKLSSQLPTIELDLKLISDEIKLVIGDWVQKNGDRLNLDASEKESLKEMLSKYPQRTYLWLKLIFEIIVKELGAGHESLETIINTLPKDIEDAYEALLEKPVDKKQAREILQIVVSAARPLELKEMYVALEGKTCDKRLGEDGKKKRFAEKIKYSCGLFVDIIDQRIYLIHHTAKEFLLSKGDPGTQSATSNAGKWRHSLDPIKAELSLTETCVYYLSTLPDSDPELIDGTAPRPKVKKYANG